MWGWATWRRAWAHYDIEMGSWPAFRDNGMLGWTARPPSSPRPAAPRVEPHPCWERHVGPPVAIHRHEPAWAVGLPGSTNLISNLGFRADATQTTGAGSMAAIPVRADRISPRAPTARRAQPASGEVPRAGGAPRRGHRGDDPAQGAALAPGPPSPAEGPRCPRGRHGPSSREDSPGSHRGGIRS